MKQLVLFISMIGVMASCGNSPKDTSTKESQVENTGSKVAPDSMVAVRFINEYIVSFGQQTDLSKWLKQSGMVTDRFISEYNKMVEEAWKEDPEMGLGFDPVLSAQDYPEKVEIESFDPETGYVIVRGVSWKEFRVILRIVPSGDKWLVDGSGVINIPSDKQLMN